MLTRNKLFSGYLNTIFMVLTLFSSGFAFGGPPKVLKHEGDVIVVRDIESHAHLGKIHHIAIPGGIKNPNVMKLVREHVPGYSERDELFMESTDIVMNKTKSDALRKEAEEKGYGSHGGGRSVPYPREWDDAHQGTMVRVHDSNNLSKASEIFPAGK
jgi:hypothetical protein